MAQAAREEGRGRPAFSFFRTDNVAAEVMGPRLLVLVCVTILTLIGIVMVFSASSIEAINDGESVFYYVIRQVIFVALGAIAAVLIARLIPDYRWLAKIVVGYYVLCMVLLVATGLFGLTALGAQRWITIGSFTLQPSEFAKIAVIAVTAYLVAAFQEGRYDLRGFLWRLALAVIPPLLLIFRAQSDLGSTIIIVVGILAIIWMGGFPRWITFGAVGVCIVFVALSSMGGYRSDRWIFLDPWSDPYGSGFQIIHSFYAFAQGGLFGKGLGNSAEKYQYLPEAETDFIFSIIGEELGLVGALIVILLFAGLFYGGVRIAQGASCGFGRVLCYGLVCMLVFQAFLNIGMCLGCAPTTGKPLPFVSSGGSSMISSMMIVGLMMFVSYCTDEPIYRRRRENLHLIRVEDGESDLPAGDRRHAGRLERDGLARDDRAGVPGERRVRKGGTREGGRTSSGRTSSGHDYSRGSGRDSHRGSGRVPSGRGYPDRSAPGPVGRSRGPSEERSPVGGASSGLRRSDLHMVDRYDIPNRGSSSRGGASQERPSGPRSTRRK